MCRVKKKRRAEFAGAKCLLWATTMWEQQVAMAQEKPLQLKQLQGCHISRRARI